MHSISKYTRLSMQVLVAVVKHKHQGITVTEICNYLEGHNDVVTDKNVRYHLKNWVQKGKVMKPQEETRKGYYAYTSFFYPTREGCRMVGDD